MYFDYYLLENSDQVKDENDFKEVAGDILVDILENHSSEIGYGNDRDNNSENLVHNDGFTRRVLPFLSEEYFKDRNERAVYGLIRDQVHRYNKAPNKDALGVALENRGGLSEQAYKDCKTIVTTITGAAPTDDTDWLLHETEKFCKDKAVYNAIIRSIEIIDGKSQNETKNAIPNILSDALSVYSTNRLVTILSRCR